MVEHGCWRTIGSRNFAPSKFFKYTIAKSIVLLKISEFRFKYGNAHQWFSSKRHDREPSPIAAVRESLSCDTDVHKKYINAHERKLLVKLQSQHNIFTQLHHKHVCLIMKVI